jgi:hypothetical protein
MNLTFTNTLISMKTLIIKSLLTSSTSHGLCQREEYSPLEKGDTGGCYSPLERGVGVCKFPLFGKEGEFTEKSEEPK